MAHWLWFERYTWLNSKLNNTNFPSNQGFNVFDDLEFVQLLQISIKMLRCREFIKRSEDHDGIRLTWNVWPPTRRAAKKLVVPLAGLYQPFKERPDLPLILCKPIQCTRTCGAILNPMCQVNVRRKLWKCNFCSKWNPVSEKYDSLFTWQESCHSIYHHPIHSHYIIIPIIRVNDSF